MGKEKKFFFFKWHLILQNVQPCRKGVSFLFKEKKERKKQQKKDYLRDLAPSIFPNQRTSRRRKAAEDSFCFFLMTLHLARSWAFGVCLLSFSGGMGAVRKPSLFFHWDPAAAVK